jgi:hypothetical protein
VGKRTTGTAAGDFLLCEPEWSGDTPAGMTRIDVPHRAALLIGRVFVADEDDRPATYALAKQIQLTPPVTFLIIPSRGSRSSGPVWLFPPVVRMIRGVLPPGRVASTDR